MQDSFNILILYLLIIIIVIYLLIWVHPVSNTNNNVNNISNFDNVTNFSDKNSVIQFKINKVISNPNVFVQKVYIYIDDPFDATARTGDNDINIDASAIFPVPIQNSTSLRLSSNVNKCASGKERKIFMTVNQPEKFECLLKQDNIRFKVKKGIVISGINPIPGGFNKLIEQVDDDVLISFIDELGNLIIVPECENNICKYIKNIETLF